MEWTDLGIVFVPRVLVIIPIHNRVKSKFFTYIRICHSLNTSNTTFFSLS